MIYIRKLIKQIQFEFNLNLFFMGASFYMGASYRFKF